MDGLGALGESRGQGGGGGGESASFRPGEKLDTAPGPGGGLPGAASGQVGFLPNLAFLWSFLQVA